HDQFIGYSRDSVDILKHNMAMNAIRSSVNANDHSAVGMNYAYTSNKMQTTAMWANIGLQAKEFVPMLHTIFFLMFSVFGFVVVIVALIPRLTAMVLGNYFKTFATLALYPFIFAVLNSIMNWSLEATTVGYANDFGGITMTNSNALDEMHTRFAAIAGYLMMSTPLIAASMFKGGAAMMGSLNYGLAG
ncbi:conjugal transfer protein TraG N-terminal domain-containing protein, partial [Vibrio sp. 10N.261.48.A2]